MSLDTYIKGTQCWFTDEKEGWISATLSTKDVAADGKVTLTFVDEHGKVCFSFLSSLIWALLLFGSLSFGVVCRTTKEKKTRRATTSTLDCAVTKPEPIRLIVRGENGTRT